MGLQGRTRKGTRNRVMLLLMMTRMVLFVFVFIFFLVQSRMAAWVFALQGVFVNT